MGQRLATVVVCVLTMGAPVAATERPVSTSIKSALTFFEARGGVSIDEFLSTLRPPPLEPAARAHVLAALPSHGAIPAGTGELTKMRLAEEVLAYHQRRGVIGFTIISVAPAFVGLHERAVILVSANALPLLSGEEFAALVGHEIAHEYVWTEYQLAVQRGDHAGLRELELRCDGIAALTLRRLGLNPDRLVSAVQTLTWYNEQRKFTANREDYVSRADRRAFIRVVAQLPWREPRPQQVP